MSIDYIGLGKRIRHYRKMQGLTQDEMARKIGICTSFFGHIERGTRKLSVETLVAIACTLNVSLDMLLTDSRPLDIYDLVDESTLLKLQSSIAYAMGELNDSMMLLFKGTDRPLTNGNLK